MDEQLMTTEEVAQLLRVSKLTVRLYAASGDLKHLRSGRKYRFRREDVEAYLNREAVPAK